MEAIQRKIKGVLIGCGKIAGIYGNNKSLTHIYSYCDSIAQSKTLKVEGCVDKDLKKAKELGAKFGIPKISDNYVNLLNDIEPQFVIVATPNETHFEIVNRVLSLNRLPDLIIVEKPLCMSIDEFKLLKDKVFEKDVKLIVNHSRRFDNRFKELKEKISTTRLGNIFRIDMNSYGEWQKNGIHLMDTIAFLFEEKINLNLIEVNKINFNTKLASWTDLSLNFGGEFILNINNNPEKYYQLFEMDFKFEKGRVYFHDFENKVRIEMKKLNYMQENILETSEFKFSHTKKSNMVVLIEEIERFFNNETNLSQYSIDRLDLSMNLFFKILPYYEN